MKYVSMRVVDASSPEEALAKVQDGDFDEMHPLCDSILPMDNHPSGKDALRADIAVLLSTINEDARMALEDEWDRSDDGFECQQTLISEFAVKYSIPLNIHL